MLGYAPTALVARRATPPERAARPSEVVSQPVVTFRRMGKQNRARRAAKAKQRRRRTSDQRASSTSSTSKTSGTWWSDGAASEVRRTAAELYDRAVAGAACRNRPMTYQALRQLAELDQATVDACVESELVRAVAVMWRIGWQPRELVRQARRAGKGAMENLAVRAVAADHAGRSPATISEPWHGQLDALGVVAGAAVERAWFAAFMSGAQLGRFEALLLAAELTAMIRSLPRLDELIPPPGGSTPGATRGVVRSQTNDVDQQVLERVRNLLAKAESTEFDAEAEAFTAKAQQLITRHAIDTALLAGDVPRGDDQPITVRIEIDDPYVDAKSLLLQVVAGANRCRTVYLPHVAMSDLIGFPADVAATEMLHASLLIQAQSALANAARTAPPGARTRSQSYRSSFLVAFANRIGERLDEVNAHLIADAEADGRSVLPVLRSRAGEVDDIVSTRYPTVRSSRVRAGSDPAGWASGRAAADQARLNLADLGATDRHDAPATAELPLLPPWSAAS